MKSLRSCRDPVRRATAGLVMVLAGLPLAACAPPSGADQIRDALASLSSPRLELAGDPLDIGHSLMAAEEYDLALRAFSRALAAYGPTQEVLIGIGSANERLGRLNQAERYLRIALDQNDTSIVAWNNLGVVLQRKRDYAGAEQAFRLAVALDSGRTEIIRRNLDAARARLEGLKPDPGDMATADFRLVPLAQRRYLLQDISTIPGGTAE